MSHGAKLCPDVLPVDLLCIAGPDTRQDLQALFEASHLTPRFCASAEEALEALRRDVGKPASVPVFIDLDHPAALEAARRVHAARPDAGIVGLGRPLSPAEHVNAVSEGVMAELLRRPVTVHDVAAVVGRLRAPAAGPGDPATSPRFPRWGLFGESAAMRDVVAQVERAAASHAGVLVTGETGTGRQTVARAIHAAGVTARAPFVAVPCHEMPPSEADERLFGRRRTAPARAASETNGETVAPGSLVHQALGGTLFFTHPEELPDRVQARLARMFRDGEVVVDSQRAPQPLQVRPIVAGSGGWTECLADGRLRLDLYRRVSAITIAVPALRDRREDIPLLADHFVGEACQTAGLEAKHLTASAKALLSAVPWRGNNRELRSLLQAVVMNVREAEIDIEALLGQIRLEDSAATPPLAIGLNGTLRDAKAQFEREYIRAVLAQNKGRIPDAAKALGIQRTNLYRKLRSLRVEAER